MSREAQIAILGGVLFVSAVLLFGWFDQWMLKS